MKTFDVAIIGGGQTGVPLSRALAEAGQKIVLFEDKHLGGSCVNFGCTPSKAIIASAHVAHQSRNAKEWGVDVGAVRVDFPAVMRRARRIVAQSKTSLDESFAHRRNPLLIAAKARLDGKRENLFVIKSAKQNVLAKHVVLNTGSRTAIPHIPGLKDVPYITGENWIGMKALPQKLIFIGGGYIALEMAQAFRRFGSEVVVLEAGDRLIEHEDADVAAAIREFLEAEGIKFILNAKIDRIVKRKGGVDVVLAGGKTVTGSHLFVATGREANTAYLGFDTIGVMRGKNGIVEVDSRLANQNAQRLGGGRHTRRPAIHQHGLRRFRRHSRSAPRQGPQDDAAYRQLRDLYRSRTWPRRHERGRGACGGKRHSDRPIRHERQRQGA